MVDPKAGKFINSLVKSLQMLCHGYMDFKDNIEIIGHIYLRIDNSQKFDYIVNEQVSKQGDDSTFFQSNSYHSLPPTKTGRERERAASGRSDDEVVTANHHRLDDTAIGGSRVQIDLSGPIPVTRNSESSPDCFFNAATIASEIRRRSHSRDSQSLAHSLEDEHQRVLASLGAQDHAHNHSNLSGARDLEQGERSASNGADRTGANSLYHVVKDTDKSRQQDSEDFRGQDGTIIIKAEPGDQNRNAEMMSIPSVSSMLPMAHQSAMLSNTAHTGHAMFAAATMGHHSMFDTSLTTSDSAEAVRQSYVQEALMHQILNAQKQTQLPHTGKKVKVFPVSLQRNLHNTENFLQPRPAHIKTSVKSKTVTSSSSIDEQLSRWPDTRPDQTTVLSVSLSHHLSALQSLSDPESHLAELGHPLPASDTSSSLVTSLSIVGAAKEIRTPAAATPPSSMQHLVSPQQKSSSQNQNTRGQHSLQNQSARGQSSSQSANLDRKARRREYNRIKQREHRARLSQEVKTQIYRRQREQQQKKRQAVEQLERGSHDMAESQ